jgi:hypothetical protein
MGVPGYYRNRKKINILPFLSIFLEDLILDLRFYENGEKLDPLEYSTGETQADVVENILDAFHESNIVFLDGKVGSGKSVLAIRTALEMGGGIVSVPTKILSDQYYNDYYKRNKYFLKDNGEKANISVFKGRNNFVCPLRKNKYPNRNDWKVSCSNKDLPCTRTLMEEESRIDALSSCPWGGTIRRGRVNLPSEFPDFDFVEGYDSIGEYGTVVLKNRGTRENPDVCPYWGQYSSYPFADIVAMNSMKFKVETWIGRIPRMPLLVIDEADAFLDNLCSKVVLSERKIDFIEDKIRDGMEDFIQKDIILDEVGRIWNEFLNSEMGPYDTADALKNVLDRTDIDLNYIYDLSKVIRYEDASYCQDERDDDDNPKVIFHIANPKPILQDILERHQTNVLMMSATKMDTDVLDKVFGINPTVVEGEPKFPGTLIKKETGNEKEVNYKKWNKSNFRSSYGRTRDTILEKMERPGFVPVHAEKYLPESIKREDITDNNRIEKDGISFSTKMDRGADLGQMNSVMVLKLPFPSLGDPLIKAQRDKMGDGKFWDYYHDMAEREFIQQIGRTVRSPGSVVEFWSPDKKAHKKLEEAWKGDVESQPA